MQFGPVAAFTSYPMWRKTRRPLNNQRDDTRLNLNSQVPVLHSKKLAWFEAEEKTERKPKNERSHRRIGC